MKPGEFPKLKLQPDTTSGGLREHMFRSLTEMNLQTIQLNSLWAFLIQLVGQFGMVLVPRVHEARFKTIVGSA